MTIDFMAEEDKARYKKRRHGNHYSYIGTATIQARKIPDYDLVVHGNQAMPEHEVLAEITQQVLDEIRSGCPIKSFSVKMETKRV